MSPLSGSGTEIKALQEPRDPTYHTLYTIYYLCPVGASVASQLRSEGRPRIMNAHRSSRRGEALTGLAVATTSIALGALPVFLLGALAVFVRGELNFSETRLGLVVATYYLASALASLPGGRLCDAVGGRRAVAIAALIGGTSMFATALLARNYETLLVFMAAAGVANGIALPASNLVIVGRIPQRMQGTAFGVKQSSGPISTLLAGASVPLLGLTVGWRWAFLLTAITTIPLVVWGRSGPRRYNSETPADRFTVPVGPLVVMAAAAATAVVGGASIAAFYVESAVANGVSPGAAGTTLAISSVLGIGFRVLWGFAGDRAPRLHVPLLSILLAVGAVSYALLGRVSTSAALLVVTITAFASAWGWPALFNYTIVNQVPQAPALATGIAGTGLFAGGIIGPPLFGAVVEASGYATAWSWVAASAACSSLLMHLGGHQLIKAREQLSL